MSPRFLERRDRPLVIGHRGASATCPENTVAAFARAMAEGADGVELDAVRCGSGEVVVVHDDDLLRVAGRAPGSEQPVRRSTLAWLRRFDLGGGERVPTLAEVLSALGPEALVNVELKSPEVAGVRGHLSLLLGDGLAEETARVLRAAGRLTGDGARATLVSSFDPLQLLRFRAVVGAAVPLGYLFHARLSYPLRQGWPAGLLRPQALHPDAALVDAVALRRWRRGGYAVHVWTVDDAHEVAALTHLGVDAIITNTPGVVRALVDSLAGLGPLGRSEELGGPAGPDVTSSPAPGPSPSPGNLRSASSRRG